MIAPDSTRWRRLDEALRRNVPLIAASLAPPASSSDLARLVALSWCPQPVIEAYSAHNGARRAGGLLGALPTPAGAPWTRVCRWMSLGEALDEQWRMCALAPPASERWLPIARFGHFLATDPYNAADERVIVHDAATGGLAALVYHDHGGLRGAICPLGIDWSAYLDALVERVESRAFAVHSDDYGVLRLEKAEVRPAPVRADPATVLLTVLAERGILRLSREPTATLLDGTRKALRKRGAPARAAALLMLFAGHDDVEEYFVSERDLAALLEQFS